jgi:hypothetical protein
MLFRQIGRSLQLLSSLMMSHSLFVFISEMVRCFYRINFGLFCYKLVAKEYLLVPSDQSY